MNTTPHTESTVRTYRVALWRRVLIALGIALSRPVVQHPCWPAGRVLPSVRGNAYGPPVAVDPHRMLVSTASWEQRAGAVPGREPVECVVRAQYADGFEGEVAATASAWSEHAVQVYFAHPDPAVCGPMYRVWVPVDRVRRPPRG